MHTLSLPLIKWFMTDKQSRILSVYQRSVSIYGSSRSVRGRTKYFFFLDFPLKRLRLSQHKLIVPYEITTFLKSFYIIWNILFIKACHLNDSIFKFFIDYNVLIIT